MSSPVGHHLVISRLREEIRRIERRAGRREGSVGCGVPTIDGLLPGGFPRGALTELVGGPASGKTAVALAVFAALDPRELAAYVDARGELYPPAAAARGVDLSRLLVVRPAASTSDASSDRSRPWRTALWACEALLASGAFGAVAMDVPLPSFVEGADAVARRLQSAAERGGAIGLWLSPGRTGLRVPAAVRLELRGERGGIAARRADVPSVPSVCGGGRAA